MEGGNVVFADDLAASVAQADARQQRVLEQIDAWAGLRTGSASPDIARVDLSRPAPGRLSSATDGVGAVIWATGYRRDFGWLKLPVRTPEGELAHQNGITSVPGLYAIGFRLLRKRDSHFIGGVGSDAEAIAGDISTFLRDGAQRAA